VTGTYHTMGGENLHEVQFRDCEFPLENLVIREDGFRKVEQIGELGEAVVAREPREIGRDLGDVARLAQFGVERGSQSVAGALIEQGVGRLRGADLGM